MDGGVKHLERLIADFQESLECEMRTGFSRLRTGIGEIRARLDTQSARLERHGGFVQAGSRWPARMSGWSGKVNTALERKEREIADLRDRLARLVDQL